jgi:voltage-gated potassium channel
MDKQPESGMAAWREQLHTIIFESDTRAGKTFDIILLIAILASVVVVVLDSVTSLHVQYREFFATLEWLFTLLFTLEYILRLVSLRQPWRYVTSFFGVIDLLSIVPSYLSLFVPGTQYLLVIRILRLLRIFRILKMMNYLNEATVLGQALFAARRKISVFLLTVVTLVIIIGAMMYVLEGEQHGFVDIPTSIYWAVVTLTTVGYGDLSPKTPIGQLFSSLVMLLGYAIIAVPTGIVSFEISRAARFGVSAQACPVCGRQGHDVDANFCKYCGGKL